ncbi:hypothetical protein FQN57_001060 [Myotisia sp. PD_48]|nr:hypothetical protein FQN57_001060 [Myotisia sp. PD_48]
MTKIYPSGLDGSRKYWKQLPIGNLSDRQWPSKRMVKAPVWLSTDLRDGNQALPNPMTFDQKWQFYKILVGIGFKEIEISFPSASDTEFNFTRSIVETPGAVPDDVTLEVLAPCRKEALKTAVDSLKGTPRAIIFTFLSSSDNYQRTIFEATEEEMLERARTCTEYVRSITKSDPEAQKTRWSFGFGLEDFGNSRPEVALRLAETIKNAWGPSKDNPIILGLATSVESHTPNVYADQVEYFSRNISDRDTVSISLHTHNDRGTAVASAELGYLAGADRIEGCLFGNGERAGNLDLVNMALNLYTQGIDPKLDLSNLPYIRQVYENITKIPVHARTPYSGDYYFRAFSGNHQDAIRKGLKKYSEAQMNMRATGGSDASLTWRVPYLPMDPGEIGRPFDCVIGINSQSGKGGISWVLHTFLSFDLPGELAASFSKAIKTQSDRLCRGLTTTEVCDLFLDTYSVKSLEGEIRLRQSDNGRLLQVKVEDYIKSSTQSVETAITQISKSFGRCARLVQSFSQLISNPQHQSMQDQNAVYMKCEIEGVNDKVWGVGIGPGGVAVVRAILSAFIPDEESPLIDTGDKSKSHGDQAGASATEVLSLIPLLVGLFLACADDSFLLVIQSTISSHFRHLSQASFLLVSYSLGYCVGLPIIGSLSDHYDGKRLLQYSYFLFAAGLFISGFGPSFWTVISGRLISGFGGAGMSSLVSILVAKILGSKRVTSVWGYISVAAIAGRALGGPIGGFLADLMGWRWTFLSQIPLVMLCVIMTAFIVPSSVPVITEKNWKMDYVGAITYCAALTSLISFFESGGHIISWDDPITMALGASFLALGILFVVVEIYSTSPLIPLKALAAANTSPILICQILATTAIALVMSNLAPYFSRTAGLSNALAAAHIVPHSFGIVLGSLSAGRLMERAQTYKLFAILGLLFSIIFYIAMAIRWQNKINLLESLYIVPIGLGFGLFNSSQFTALNLTVHEGYIGISTGLFYLCREFGFLFGTILSSTFIQTIFRSMLEKSLKYPWPEKEKLISGILGDIDFANSLPKNLQVIVSSCYAHSFRWIPAFSAVSLLLVLPVVISHREVAMK